MKKTILILTIGLFISCGLPDTAYKDELSGCLIKTFNTHIIYECKDIHTIYYFDTRKTDTLWVKSKATK